MSHQGNNMLKNAENLYDAALGSLLGACVGDAAGATLEFIGRKPTKQEVQNAMTMPGGGVWRVAPGQITDDSELGICLARSLSDSKQFDIEAIAQSYADWVRSNPFDIGTTTRHSLGCFQDFRWKRVGEQQGYTVAMTDAASQLCLGSKSNGSLMRSSSLGIWGRVFNDNDIATFAQKDSSLSHPNSSCWQAVACYSIAIARLMNKHGDRAGAFKKAKSWAESKANNEVRQWLKDAENNVNVAYHPLAGFVKIGFTHAFRHLLLGSNYVDAIRETLEGGGDTDTNACIVGGLVGAAGGASSIPDMMKLPVLNCRTELGRPRPDFLHTSQIPELVDRLISVHSNCFCVK